MIGYENVQIGDHPHTYTHTQTNTYKHIHNTYLRYTLRRIFESRSSFNWRSYLYRNNISQSKWKGRQRKMDTKKKRKQTLQCMPSERGVKREKVGGYSPLMRAHPLSFSLVLHSKYFCICVDLNLTGCLLQLQSTKYEISTVSFIISFMPYFSNSLAQGSR